jgi:type VI secretion system secreted protein VgrG
VEAQQSIELKVGGSSILIDNGGVTITGSAKVEIKGVTVETAGSALNTVKGALVKIN